jgi:hypothetical protein
VRTGPKALDRDLVELRDADRGDRIETLAFKRLQQLERRRRALLQERDADLVQPRADLQALLEALLHFVARERRLKIVRLLVLPAEPAPRAPIKVTRGRLQPRPE